MVATPGGGGRWRRLFEVLWTILYRRRDYAIANIDVYSGRAFRLSEIASTLVGLLGKPICLTLHGGALPKFTQQHPNRFRRLIDRACEISSPSEYLAAIVPKGMTARVIPNPLDLRNYRFKQRTKLNPKLVWLRAYEDLYDPGLALEIVAELRKAGIDANMTMAGPATDPKCRQKLSERIKTLDLESRVHLGGPLHKRDIPEFLQQGDILLNTSRIDNVPVSVLEAMACGLLVVTADVGGMRHVLRDGLTGCLVPGRYPEDFARTIQDLLSDPQRASSISSAARTAVEEFDWMKIYPKWEQLFKNMLPSSD